MKILIFSWLHEFTLYDIKEALKELNITFDVIQMDISNKNKSDCHEIYDFVYSSLSTKEASAVFSVNYFPDIAKACFDKKTIYISWSYDCPLDIVKPEDTISLPTNRAFFFDRNQYLEYKNNNNTVFHAPLGVNAKRLANVQFNPKYASDISFVGKVYHSSYPTLKKYLDEYYIGYCDGLIESQKKVYGAYLIKEAISSNMLEQINKSFKSHDCPYTKDNNLVSLNQLAYSLVMESTFENRLMCLGLLSKSFDLKWYTTPDSESLEHINKCPPVNYKNEMPQVFKSSKINLHIGLHAISSGISLRQLDIMACGGFLLSSFQPELFDYFVAGEDFDYFSSPEEAYEKASFYLTHEDLRKKITNSGNEKVLQYFDNKNILSEIINQSFN